MRYGRLTVIEKDIEMSKRVGRTCWKCKCDCGSVISVRGNDLHTGHTKSCGCYNLDKIIERNTTHNMKHTRLYHTWCNIKSRCNYKNRPDYHRYGGRGIKVCKEWEDFTNFYNWAMNNGYEDDLTIDRIDVNGNYEPSNCRWVDIITQANNTRRNLYITINGETKSLRQWYRIYNPNYCYDIIRERYHKEGFQSVDQLFRDKAS